jgi:hypothetical protein
MVTSSAQIKTEKLACTGQLNNIRHTVHKIIIYLQMFFIVNFQADVDKRYPYVVFALLGVIGKQQMFYMVPL